MERRIGFLERLRVRIDVHALLVAGVPHVLRQALPFDRRQLVRCAVARAGGAGTAHAQRGARRMPVQFVLPHAWTAGAGPDDAAVCACRCSSMRWDITLFLASCCSCRIDCAVVPPPDRGCRTALAVPGRRGPCLCSSPACCARMRASFLEQGLGNVPCRRSALTGGTSGRAGAGADVLPSHARRGNGVTSPSRPSRGLVHLCVARGQARCRRLDPDRKNVLS